MFEWRNAQSLLGLVVCLVICWICSEDRARFPWRMAVGALGLQLGLVALLFGFPPARGALIAAGWAVDALASSTQAGSAFVFGYLAGGDTPFAVTNTAPLYLFAFRVVPVILVVCALSALLWRWGVLKWLTQGFGLMFSKTLHLDGPTALGAAATVFLGQVEGPIFVRGYLGALGRSELFTLMAVGLSCVSGSTMVAYATLLKGVIPGVAAHVLTASLISAPAGVLLARILVPDDGKAAPPLPDGEARIYDSTTDAVIRGVGDGLQIALNVAATLIVFVALVALANRLLALVPPVLGAPITIQRALGALLTPLAWTLGLPWREAGAAGRLLGTKLVLTEFSAFADLARAPVGELSLRSRRIMIYALCSFANIASVGITAAGFAVLAPNRRAEVNALVWRALLAGFLATCMTASMIGVLPDILFAG